MSNKKMTAAEKVIAELGIEAYEFAPGITIQRPSQRVIEAAGVLVDNMPHSEEEGLTVEQAMELFKVLLGDQYADVMEYLETFPVEGYPALFADLFVNVFSMVPREHKISDLTDSLSGEVVTRWKALNPEDSDLFD